MYLGRVLINGWDGDDIRIVTAPTSEGPWYDVRKSECIRLERAGATPSAAMRISNAIAPSSITAAIEAGPAFIESAKASIASAYEETIAPSDALLIAPADPPAYRDFMVFERHFSFGYKWRKLPVPEVLYEFPVSYMGSAQGIVGPEETIVWPDYSEFMDYELELGIVIGRGGSNIRPEDALEHVLGLTILNDFSARDMQMREMAAGLGPCKGKHFSTAIGPAIATLDELDVKNLRMISKVNNETWCDASSGEMIWSIAEIVAWASAHEVLAAGTVLGTGTCNGGSGIEIDKKLKIGDTVELSVDGIGVLRNKIGKKVSGWTPARKQIADVDLK